MIQGHDGSQVLAYGDYRDAIILELEKRIYNNIQTKYDPTIFDIYNIIPGYHRTSNFTLDEFNKQFTLCKNINKTFNQCLLLLQEQDYIQIMKLIREKTYEINRYLGTSTKNLRSYYKKYYNYEDSKKRECSTAIAFSSFLINILDEKATDYWFGL